MSLYWRTYPTTQNTDLPQKIMRPFWHPVAETLDDNNFTTILAHEKPKYIPYMMLFASLLIFYISVNGLIQFSESYPDIKQWNNENIYTLATYSLIAITAGLLVYLFSRVKQPRTVNLNRQQHTVKSSTRSLLPGSLNHSYDDMTGAIECYKSPFGKRKSWLVLKHKTEKHKIRLSYTYDNPQQLIGYWSFIVQYMKKNGPLPDVAALHHYPNKTDGVTGSPHITV